MGKAKRVLLVEDNPSLRDALRDYLTARGFVTVEAADGVAAMNRLAEAAPDLVCVDLMLPAASGYEVCEFIRRQPGHEKTPVLVMSARAHPEDRACAAEAGANAFIAKPFEPNEIVARIEALLSRPFDGEGDANR